MNLKTIPTQDLKRELVAREQRELEINKWKETILRNYINKHPILETKISELLSFFSLSVEPLKLDRLSVPDALKKLRKWQRKSKEVEKNLKSGGVVLPIWDLPKGFKVVRLLDDQSLEWESDHMGHCISEYDALDSELYSIRDAKGFPHCTIHLDLEEKLCIQAVGKGNFMPGKQYLSWIFNFLNYMGIKYIAEDSTFFLHLHRVTPALKKHLDYHFKTLNYYSLGRECYVTAHNAKVPLAHPVVKKSKLLFEILIKANISTSVVKQVVKDKLIKDLTTNPEYIETAIGSFSYEMTNLLLELGSPEPRPWFISNLLDNYELNGKEAELVNRFNSNTTSYPTEVVVTSYTSSNIDLSSVLGVDSIDYFEARAYSELEKRYMKWMRTKKFSEDPLEHELVVKMFIDYLNTKNQTSISLAEVCDELLIQSYREQKSDYLQKLKVRM